MKKIRATFVFILIVGVANSQLPNFTLWNNTQTALNPSLASYQDDDVRLNTIYRSQSYNKLLTTNFLSASLLLRPFREIIATGDVLGLGVDMFSTKTLSSFSQQSAALSLAYAKSLDYKEEQKISLGFQARYNSKRIDLTQLLFPNQFDIIGYTNVLPNNEPIQGLTANYFDINSGFNYSFSNENEELVAGFSLYNINQVSADKAVLQNRIERTTNLHFSYSKFISTDAQILIGVFHSIIRAQRATFLTAAYGISPSYDNSVGVDFGLIYQINNSISPYLSMNLNSLKVIMAYDLGIKPNISYLQKARAFEIGIQYRYNKPNTTKAERIHLSCFK
jgi:type IX secretion system PorP/SprF family membrane protein